MGLKLKHECEWKLVDHVLNYPSCPCVKKKWPQLGLSRRALTDASIFCGMACDTNRQWDRQSAYKSTSPPSTPPPWSSTPLHGADQHIQSEMTVTELFASSAMSDSWLRLPCNHVTEQHAGQSSAEGEGERLTPLFWPSPPPPSSSALFFWDSGLC